MRRRAHPPSGGGDGSPSSSSSKSSTARRKTTSRVGGRGGHAAPGGLSCGPAAVLGTVALVLGLCLLLMASMLDDGVTTTSGEGGGGDGTKDGARGLFRLRGGPRLHLGDIGGAFSPAAKAEGGEEKKQEEMMKEEEFYCERFRPPEAKEQPGPTPAEERDGNERVLLYTFRHGAGQGLGQGIGGAAFAYGMALMCNRTFKMDFMVGKYKLEDVLAGEVGTNRTRWWSLVTPEERDWLHSKQKVTVSDFSGVKLASDAAAYDQCKRDDLDVLVMLSYDYFPAALLSPDHFPAPYRQERWESHLDVEQDLSGCAWSLFADPPGGGDGDLTPMVAHLRAGDMAYHGGKGGETRKIVRTTGSVEKAAEAALKCLDETVPPDHGDGPCEIVFVSDSRQARDYAANTFRGRCKVRLTDATDKRPDWTSGMTLEQTRTTWDDFYLMWAAERVVITGSAFSCGAVKNYLKRKGATVYRLEDEIAHGTLCTGEGHRRDFVGDRVPPPFVHMAGQCRMNDEFSYLGAG